MARNCVFVRAGVLHSLLVVPLRHNCSNLLTHSSMNTRSMELCVMCVHYGAKVLRPEIEKLRDIMEFHESAVQVFCVHVETLARRGKKQVVPEGLYDALIAVVDLLQKIVSCSEQS